MWEDIASLSDFMFASIIKQKLQTKSENRTCLIKAQHNEEKVNIENI